MTRITTISAKYVGAIPSALEDGVLYVSTEYATAVHKCCCGCGQEVVTPLGPTDWKVTVHGSAVTMYPSIGNWSFTCRSHYWINRGQILWAEDWSEEQIKYGRNRDRMAKQTQFNEIDGGKKMHVPRKESGFWAWLRRLLIGR